MTTAGITPVDIVKAFKMLREDQTSPCRKPGAGLDQTPLASPLYSTFGISHASTPPSFLSCMGLSGIDSL